MLSKEQSVEAVTGTSDSDHSAFSIQHSAFPLPPDTERVAVVMLDHHMGNTVVALPTVAALAEYFLHGVDLIVDERWAGIAEGMAGVTVRPMRVRGAGRERGVVGQIKAFAQMLALRGKYDVAIDLTGTKRGNLAAWCTRAKRRVGQAWSERAWCFTDLVPGRRDVHCLELYGQMLACVGRSSTPGAVRLMASAASRERVAAVLPDGPFVVIHPCAGKAYREWPADRFAAVAAGLHEAHGLACVVIGTPGDRATVDALFTVLPDAVPRSFVTVKPADLVAVFERAALLLSNESGPTHIAAATDVPIVTIFGPTPEARWRPIRDDSIAVLRGGDCDPACGRRQCVVGNRCLRELSVDTVMQHAAALAADRVRISS